MGEREIYIIRMPELLKQFLVDFKLGGNKTFINAFIEDLTDVAKSMMYNMSGVVTIDPVIEDLKSVNFDLTPQFIDYFNRIITDICLELLQTLVIHNIHNRLFYVDVSSSREIVLLTYDGEAYKQKNKGI